MKTITLTTIGINSMKHRSSGVLYKDLHMQSSNNVSIVVPISITAIIPNSISVTIEDSQIPTAELLIEKALGIINTSCDRIDIATQCPLCNRSLLISDGDYLCTNICCQSSGMVAEGLYQLCPNTTNSILPVLERFPEMYNLSINELFGAFHSKLTAMDAEIVPYLGIIIAYMKEFCSITFQEFMYRLTYKLSSIDIAMMSLALNDSLSNLYFKVSNDQLGMFNVNITNILCTIVNNNMELLGTLVKYRLLYR